MAEGKTIKFHYIKSPFFRTIHVDGIIGGPTPQGNIHIAFYNERPAILQSSEHELLPDGTLSPGVEKGKEGFVREMDCDVVITRSMAEGLLLWLQGQISEMDLPTDGDLLPSIDKNESD